MSALHYGLQCFEGMKAYKDAAGGLRLFRPEQNMARMNRTSMRLSMRERVLKVLRRELQLLAHRLLQRAVHKLHRHKQ